MTKKTNIALIGMPGAGKSTVGKLLAEQLDMNFCDTDQLIEQTQQSPLQDILDTKGFEALRAIEQQTILDHQFDNSVIATGGSVIYGADGIAHLQSCATLFYINASIDTLTQRINNWSSRGIACPQSQSFDQLFAERALFYKQYADHTILADGQNSDINHIVAQIVDLWRGTASTDPASH
ncbi:shikimate kinase [Pseudomonadales bacterium]|nr:shikimate kinase [Pseudomonadales bacterium]